MTESKADYVRRQPQSRFHTCHWPGCEKQVPPAMWGCALHWYKLPTYLRREIWQHYRPGQETDMRPSKQYIQVAERVQEWIREHVQEKVDDSDHECAGELPF